MGIKKARVFTVRSVNYKESDSILTFFGRERGKFSALAKGARKSEKRFGAAVDLLNLSEIVYYERTNLNFVSQADLLESWEELRTRASLLDAAMNSARLLNLYSEEQDPQPSLFDAFEATLRALEEKPKQARVVQLGFYLKLLQLSGIQPHLRRCVYCGQPVEGISQWVFSPSAGGLVCGDCKDEGEAGMMLEEGLRKSLTALLELPQDRVGVMRLTEDRLDRAFRLLDRFASYHLRPDQVESSR